MKDREPDNQDDLHGSDNRHRITLIIVTVVLVLVPLALGTMRLAGYL